VSAQIEGFKLHVMHNQTPFKNKVRFTPEAASRPDRIEKDLANCRTLAALLEAEYAHNRRLPERPADAPADWERATVEQDALLPENADADVDVDPEDPEPRERGAEAVERRAERIADELQARERAESQDERARALQRNTVTLDLYLAYLRAAFHTCYYCAIVTDHLEEFQRKCICHVRKPLSKAMLDEIRAQEARAEEEGGKDKEKKEGERKAVEARDWKRNGECHVLYVTATGSAYGGMQTNVGSSGWTRRLRCLSTGRALTRASTAVRAMTSAYCPCSPGDSVC
jgi:hypothetical protein